MQKNDFENNAVKNVFEYSIEQIVEQETKSGSKALKRVKNKPLVGKDLKGNVLVCPNCGNIVKEEHNYCYDCGARLK